MSTGASLQYFAELRKAERQHIARAERQHIDVQTNSTRLVLAAAVAHLMKLHPDRDTPAKLSRRCFWPAGKKKGKRVSERQLRYVLDTRADAVPPIPSPSLDLIVAIANAFDVPAWQLLVDDKQAREWVVDRLFAGPVRPGATLLEPEARLLQAPAKSTVDARRKPLRARR